MLCVEPKSKIKRIFRTIRWLMIFSSFSLMILGLIVLARTLLIPNQSDDLAKCSLNIGDQSVRHHKAITSEHGIFERFQQALRFRTITKAPKQYSHDETLKFITFLKKNFPLIHSSSLVNLTVINELSLLYKIEGTNKLLKPYMLLAHMDVVPVQENMWTIPPFEGFIRDEYIYGRGALDLKCVLMGIMEALEFMLSQKTPIERSFYITFGHDEEGRGLDGAAQVSRYMVEQNLNDLEFILDEGPYIFRNALPGISRDVAMIGVAEKGLVNIMLSVNGTVGHSSLPPKETAIVKLARAVSKLTADSHPNMFGYGPERDMVEALAPFSSIPYRLLYANLWLFAPLVAQILSRDKLMNSFIRTTTAVTIFHSGIKDNVLPGRAEAVVNHRIYPLEKIQNVLEYDRKLIDDPEVDVQVLGVGIEPHPISPYTDRTFGYQTIRRSIRQVFTDSAIIPGMMYAATDTRWFLNFTKNIYRFSPGYITPQQFSIVHGHDERISKENYVKVVNFYHHIMVNSNSMSTNGIAYRDEFR